MNGDAIAMHRAIARWHEHLAYLCLTPQRGAVGEIDILPKDSQVGYMIRSTISETKNRLSELLAKVRRGETLIIMDRKMPVARVERLSSPSDNPALNPAESEWNPEAILSLPLATGDAGMASLVEAVREERRSGW